MESPKIKGNNKFLKVIKDISNSDIPESKLMRLREFFLHEGFMHEAADSERSCLVNFHRIYKQNNFGPATDFLVEPYSSGEDSDIEDDIDYITKIKEVETHLIDTKTILIINSLEDLPSEVRPGLLFSNVDEWMTQGYIKQFLEETPIFL